MYKNVFTRYIFIFHLSWVKIVWICLTKYVIMLKTQKFRASLKTAINVTRQATRCLLQLQAIDTEYRSPSSVNELLPASSQPTFVAYITTFSSENRWDPVLSLATRQYISVKQIEARGNIAEEDRRASRRSHRRFYERAIAQNLL